MTAKPGPKDVPVPNPRYSGVMSELVVLALLRHEPESDGGKLEGDPSGIIG
jgi:hypothetical protein